jgi:hypothetical protein
VPEGGLEHKIVAPVPRASVFMWLMVPGRTCETQFCFGRSCRACPAQATDISPVYAINMYATRYREIAMPRALANHSRRAQCAPMVLLGLALDGQRRVLNYAAGTRRTSSRDRVWRRSRGLLGIDPVFDDFARMERLA